MPESDMDKACNTIAKIIKNSWDFEPEGAPIAHFMELINDGETPKMAAAIVKKLYNDEAGSHEQAFAMLNHTNCTEGE